MEIESLKNAIDVIIEALSQTNMNEVDKIELMINLSHFLNKYEENIKVLQRKNGTLF